MMNFSQRSRAMRRASLVVLMCLVGAAVAAGGLAGPAAAQGVYGSLGGYVWEDSDGDGIQEPGAGVAGVGVTAVGSDVFAATTGGDGFWQISDVPPGVYSVVFATPSGGTWTVQDAGSDDAVDSDVDPSGNAGVHVVVADAITTIDAGTTAPTLDPSPAIVTTVVPISAPCPASFADAVAGGGVGLDRIPADVGDVVKYCVILTNNGPGDAVDVTVYNELDPAAPRSFNSLAAGEELSYLYLRAVEANPETSFVGLQVANLAGELSPLVADPAGTIAPSTNDKDAKLLIIKSVLPAGDNCPKTFDDAKQYEGLDTVAADKGDIVIFCLNVMNRGNGVAGNVVVTDSTMPDKPIEVGELAPGEEFNFGYKYEVTGDDRVTEARVTGVNADGGAIDSAADPSGFTRAWFRAGPGR